MRSSVDEFLLSCSISPPSSLYSSDPDFSPMTLPQSPSPSSNSPHSSSPPSFYLPSSVHPPSIRHQLSTPTIVLPLPLVVGNRWVDDRISIFILPPSYLFQSPPSSALIASSPHTGTENLVPCDTAPTFLSPSQFDHLKCYAGGRQRSKIGLRIDFLRFWPININSSECPNWPLTARESKKLPNIPWRICSLICSVRLFKRYNIKKSLSVIASTGSLLLILSLSFSLILATDDELTITFRKFWQKKRNSTISP